eukprot:scaffold133413_cov99-Phaeocystis_antarctica.AAC.1
MSPDAEGTHVRPLPDACEGLPQASGSVGSQIEPSTKGPGGEGAGGGRAAAETHSIHCSDSLRIRHQKGQSSSLQ